MKKKMYLFLFVFILAVSQATPIFASNWIAASDTLEAGENETIDNIANEIYNSFGIEVYFAYDVTASSAKDLAVDTIKNRAKGDKYAVFAFTQEKYILLWSSSCDSIFTDEDTDNLWDAIADYEEQGLYQMAARFYSEIGALIASRSAPDNTTAENNVQAVTLNKPNQYKYVVDQVGLLTEEQASALNDKLVKFSEENKFDLVIVTATGVESSNRMAYADDYYDNNGYGVGDDKDGALLLVNVAENGVYSTGNCWISTCGKGIKYFTDSDIQDIGSEITPILLGARYDEAFNRLISLSQELIDDYGRMHKGIIALSAILVGIIGAFIYTGVLKGQLKSVEEARDANDYLVDGSLQIDKKYDVFLYANVVKTAKEKSSSSSTHSSSSGRTHGGGGF